jgi:hypothetical protein
MTDADDSAALPPALLLHRIAAELARCQSLLDRIEHSVQVIMAAPSPGMILSARRSELQDIDLLGQSLGDLALCLRSAAATVPLSAAADLDAGFVLGELRLQDLRHRLVGRPGAAPEVERIELF